MEPGPDDASVLTLQAQHRSRGLWDAVGQGPTESAVLAFRRCEASLRRHGGVSLAVLQLVRQAGLGGLHDVPFRSLDCGLVTALVERWRPETHTFHLRSGEATVTLQDVELILGLPVDGKAVTGRTDYVWENLCEELLGIRPPPEARKGGRLKLGWLRVHFQGLVADDAAPEVVAQQARGYILQLLGGTIFADHSSQFVHLCYLPLLEDFALAGTYAWGADALAVLYNQLCHGSTIGSKDVGGAFVLLQIWAWDRLPHFAPRRLGRVLPPPDRPLLARWRDDFKATDFAMHVVSSYRYRLDIGVDDEFSWVPYSPALIGRLPPFCRAGVAVWTACVPLIRFATVELHQPDRVQRQFGYRQGIPSPSRSLTPPHGQDMRAGTKDWSRSRAHEIAVWEQRLQYVLPVGVADDGVYPLDDPYRSWYDRITRRFISRQGACTGRMLDYFERLLGPQHLPVSQEVGRQCIHLMEVYRSLLRGPPPPPPDAVPGDDAEDEAPPVQAFPDVQAPDDEAPPPPVPVVEDLPVFSDSPEPEPSSSAVPTHSQQFPLFDQSLTPVDWAMLGRLGSVDPTFGEGAAGSSFSSAVEQLPKRRREEESQDSGGSSSGIDGTVPSGSMGVVTQVEQEAATPIATTRPRRVTRATRCGTGGHMVHRPSGKGGR